MASSLPLSNFIPVSVSILSGGNPGPLFNQGLLLGSSAVIPASQRVQQFTSLAAVANGGFSLTSPEYLGAAVYFGQTPQPFFLNIGRQDLTAVQAVPTISAGGSGYVVGDVVTLVQGGGSGCTLKVTSVSTGVVTGLQIVTPGTGYVLGSSLATTGGTGTGLTLTVSSCGDTPLQALVAARTVSQNWYICQFVSPYQVVSATALGTASNGSTSLTTASAAGAIANGQIVVGVGIQPGTTVTGSGSSWTLSLPTTAALSSTALTFYTPLADSDHVAMAGFCEAASPYSQYHLTTASAAVTTSTPATATGSATAGSTSLAVSNISGTIAAGQFVTGVGIAPGTTVVSGGPTTWTISQQTTALVNGPVTFTGNVMATLQALGYRRTMSSYATTQGGAAPNNPYLAAAVMGYAMGANTWAPGSYFTINNKTLAGIIPENSITGALTQTQITAIAGTPQRTSIGLNGNLYLNYAASSYLLFQNGTMANGGFFDTVLFVDMLVTQVQINLANLLTGALAVPLTAGGQAQVLTVTSQACQQSQQIGFIAPSGTWNGPTVGPYTPGTPLPNGFAVYAPPISALTTGQKQARQFPPVTVLVISAGAGQSIAVQIDVI